MNSHHTLARHGIDRTKPNDVFDLKAEGCGTCRFWHPSRPDSDPPKDGAKVPVSDGFGYCRRNPPRIIETLVAMNVETPRFGQHVDADDAFSDTRVFDSTSFPSTWATNWCGEFDWVERLRPVEMLP